MLDEVLSLLLKNGSLVLDGRNDTHWSTVKFPFVVVFSAREFIVELFADFVCAHALIDFFLELFDHDTNFTDVLLGLGELLNILGNLSDLSFNFSEFVGDFVIVLSCSLGDLFDFLFNDLVVLSDIHVSNILDIDSEDGDNDVFRNSFLKLLLKCSNSENIGLDGHSISRFFSFTLTFKLFDVFVWIKFVFLLKLTESLDILIEWLNSSPQCLLNRLSSFPQPGVFIWKHGLFGWINWCWLSLWSNWSLEHLLTVILEKMFQQDWLKLGNFLKDFDTFIKYFHDLGDNFLWVGGVGWDQVSLLQDEIKIE
jgi:hypothetical protein